MERDNMVQRNIQIRDDQDAFLKEQRRAFNFSKFVRVKLDEYMKFKKGLQKEVQNDRNETIK